MCCACIILVGILAFPRCESPQVRDPFGGGLFVAFTAMKTKIPSRPHY
jgi:hypothetical protein